MLIVVFTVVLLVGIAAVRDKARAREVGMRELPEEVLARQMPWEYRYYGHLFEMQAASGLLLPRSNYCY